MKKIIAIVIFTGPIFLGMFCVLGYMVGFIEAVKCLGRVLLFLALIYGWIQFAWYIIERHIKL